MSQLFQSLMMPLAILQDLPAMFGVSPGAFSASALFSGAGTLILGKFTAQIGWLTGPINFCSLLAASVFTNWLFGGLDLPLFDPEFQAPLVYTVAGMTVAALSLILLMQEE